MDRQFDEQFDTLGFDSALESNPESPETFGGRRLDLGEEELFAVSDLVSEVLEAEDEAVRNSEAEWLETEWLETSGDIGPGETVEMFAERLARTWSGRKPDGPDAEARRVALIKDHSDTLAAARMRWSPKKVKPDFWDRISRAWRISREEEMRFETEGASVPGLPLAPPSARVPLTEDRLVGGTLDKEVKGKLVPGAKIAPLTVRFAHALKSRHRSVGMTNYHNHGGGSFLNRGYSLDLWLGEVDERGFFRQEDALRLLRAVDAAARAVGAQWRVLYNDFTVADTINRELRRKHVVFMGRVRRDKAGRLGGLNWHGPGPLILHFHLDITPISGVDQSGETGEEESSGPAGEWTGESVAGEEELLESRGRYDPDDPRPASEGPYEHWNETGEQEDLDFEQPGASPLETAGLTRAERKALDITSTFETGRPGSFFGLTGNDDGQGLSFGLVNWPIGTGSLQPLLRAFAAEQPMRWARIFGPDAERFRQLILPRDAVAAQLRFAIDEMNGTRIVKGRTRWFIKAPWSDYFRRLADDIEFQKIEVRFVRPMMRKAAQYCRQFGLKSEMAFAFMFDAVSSHGGAWLKVHGREKLLQQKLKERGTASSGSAGETDLLLAIADVLAETSKKRYSANVRQRKRWFVLGDAELERRRGLTGMRPSPSVPYEAQASASAREDEDLAWLAYEAGNQEQMFEDEDEWTGEGGFETNELAGAAGFSEGYEYGEAYETPESWSGEGETHRCSCRDKAAAERHETSWQSEEAGSSHHDMEDEGAGGEALAEAPFQAYLTTDEALAEAYYNAEEEEFDQETVDCSAPLGPYECGDFRGQKPVIRAGYAKGLLVPRAVLNPRTELSLQFSDYDINATNSQKEAHQDGLDRVTQFVLARVRAGSPQVVVHLSGSASQTDSASYNRKLACHRARCLASSIRAGLDPFTAARTTFVIDDKGFDEAICRTYPGGKGQNCELGEYRSVRVTVTGPDGKIVPVPISPAHDKFEIRVCRFASKPLDVVAMDELLSRAPAGMPRIVAEALAKMVKAKLIQSIEKRLSMELKFALRTIAAELKWIPIQFLKQEATFEIRERGKKAIDGRPPEIRSITLCYDGWGARLAIPFDELVLEGIDKMLAKARLLQNLPVVRQILGKALKYLLSDFVTHRLRLPGTEVPGEWKPFTTSKPVLLEKFAGKADILIDLISGLTRPGTIRLSLESFEWNPQVNAFPNKLLCGDCSGPIIPLIVSGGGFDIWSVNTGKMTSRNCVCVPVKSQRLLEFA